MKKIKLRLWNSKGFSIIECFIVVAIVAILTVMFITQMKAYRERQEAGIVEQKTEIGAISITKLRGTPPPGSMRYFVVRHNESGQSYLVVRAGRSVAMAPIPRKSVLE